MVPTTKAQRQALKRVYDRICNSDTVRESGKRPAYRDFRRTVQPTFGCDGAVMVPFAGMWLGIERDGYTHS